MIFLADLFRGSGKSLRGNRVELEHFVMTGNDKISADLFSELCGFFPGEITRHSARWITPVYGEQGKIDLPIPQPIH
jgi:hypothetical protein